MAIVSLLRIHFCSGQGTLARQRLSPVPGLPPVLQRIGFLHRHRQHRVLVMGLRSPQIHTRVAPTTPLPCVRSTSGPDENVSVSQPLAAAALRISASLKKSDEIRLGYTLSS